MGDEGEPRHPAPAEPAGEHRSPPPPAWRPILAIAGAVAVGHLIIAGRYGWHRDEFYYVASGRHLAWGYPDQPPLTPVLARLAAALPGGVYPLRVVAIGLQAATIVLGGLIARELGGRRQAQAVAAGCVAGGGIFVGASLLLGTTVVDQFFWALVIWATLRALRAGTDGAWVLVGVAAGLGLENKHTMALLLAGIAVGLLVTRRDVLARPGPWLAGGLAALLWAPNLWWDAQHGWITLDMARVIADDQGGVAGAAAQLPILLLLLPSPLLVAVWVGGVRWGVRNRAGRPTAWLLVATGVVVVAVVAGGGKPYYAAPMLVPLFAMGAVAIERSTPQGSGTSRWVVASIVAAVITSALIGLPVITPAVSTALRPLDKEPMETYGWPGFARQVARAWAQEPGAVAVYAGNYGEAGALEYHWPGRSRPPVPVVSGQNAYRYWGPPAGSPTDVVAVGRFSRAFLLRSWARVERVAPITLPDDLENDETGSHAAIWRCRQPRGTWARLWPRLTFLG